MTQNDQPVRYESKGTVSCTINGDRYRLRRPTMGELRELRETVAIADDEVAEEADPYRSQLRDLRQQVRDLRKEDASDEDLLEARRLKKELREISRKVEVGMDAVRAGWVRRVFKMLADNPLPEPEGDDPAINLEPWVVSAEFASDLLVHWRSVPKASGGPATENLELP